MGKLRTISGVTKTMLSGMKEDWDGMDKKFYRVAFGVAGFIAMALFWYYVIRNFSPFGF